jgi:hypothetical protein
MDPLSFPVLAGAALNQAFGFLFGRLTHLLNRRNEQRSEHEVAETPPVLEGQLGPLVPHEETVAAHLPELRTLAAILGVYEQYPERLDSHNTTLRQHLSRLRNLLEEIYGQHITFRGEPREPSGVLVEQRMDLVSGDVTGVRGQRVRRVHVRQELNQVLDGSSVVGLQGDDIG